MLLALGLTAALPAPAAAQGQPLTVYSSMPLQGASRPSTLDLVRGIDLALREAGGRAGGFQVRHLSLDDSTARAGTWAPERVVRNARRAARDQGTVTYIGDFNSGASAISIPILNEAGIAQVSPSNAATGLTTRAPGVERGEPEKYYPTNVRNFVRLPPHDAVQGRALASLLRGSGCTRPALVHDGEVYGRTVAAAVASDAKRIGMPLTSSSRISPRASNYRRLARRLRGRRADCVAFAGITANNAVQLFRDLARALRRAKLFGSDGIAEAGFSDPREGGVPARVGRRVRVLVNTLPPDEYPEPGRQFFARFTAAYRDRSPDPYALYGYEAMRLVLDAIARGGSSRAGVIAALLATRDRDTGLGRISFDANGDSGLSYQGVYRIRSGALVFERTITPAP